MRAQLRRTEESIVDVEFCLVFPHEALSVPVMRRVLGDTLRRLGADEDGVADLLLAVTEACTNVLKHGTPARLPAGRRGRAAAAGPGTSR
jgi:serine/threonine-protein kinase RsbW